MCVIFGHTVARNVSLLEIVCAPNLSNDIEQFICIVTVTSTFKAHEHAHPSKRLL